VSLTPLFSLLRVTNPIFAFKAKDNDIENVCFVCGIERETFDKRVPGGYDEHIRLLTGDHCMWNYLDFIVYLRERDPTLFTGPEQYVFELLTKKDLAWFPQHRCISLDQQKETDEATMRITQLKEAQAETQVKLASLEAKFALLFEKLDSLIKAPQTQSS